MEYQGKTDAYRVQNDETKDVLKPVNVILTYASNRANMSPTKGFCPDGIRPAVSLVFAQTEDEALINRVLSMLLQSKYEEEGDGDR